MFPRDPLTPAPVGISAARPQGSRRSKLRHSLLVAPYVPLLLGAVVLARTPDTYFERFWWLAPLAVLAYLGVLSLTVGSLAGRRNLARRHREEVGALLQKLRRAPEVPEAGAATLAQLMPRLREVLDASRYLPSTELATLRQALTELDAHAAVVAKLRRSRSRWRRADALFELGWLADERSIPVLREALNGGDPDLGYVAGQALAEYQSATACGCLVEALRNGCIPRPLAATLLEGSNFAQAPALVAAAGSDPDPEVRSWVAYLHGRSRAPQAGAWLAVLAGDPEAEVRASAAEALGRHPNAEILGSLLGDSQWMVRANAAKAVGQARLEHLAPALSTLLRDRVWWVRQSATLSLKQLGPAAIAAVRPMLDDDDRFARNKAAEVLIDIGYVSAQIKALRGEGPEVARATESLAAILHAGAPAMIEASTDADPVIRRRLSALLAESVTPPPVASGGDPR